MEKKWQLGLKGGSWIGSCGSVKTEASRFRFWGSKKMAYVGSRQLILQSVQCTSVFWRVEGFWL